MKAMIIAIIFILASEAYAMIINIPADYPTIQQGIDASNNGDTVLVQPGTYYENINFNGHNIVLGSLFLTTGDTSYIEQTVIDGNAAGSVITLNTDEDSTTALTGFTITNGKAVAGAGIYCDSASPKILSNHIISNSSDIGFGGLTYGGGIYCVQFNGIIMGNSFIDNLCESPDFAAGGAVYCRESDFLFSDNLIESNEAWGRGSGGWGGGIYC